MIDIAVEEKLTIKEACKLPELRRNGKAVHFSTAWRWIGAGKLESVVIGGVRMTSREAVQRMIATANPGVIPEVSPRQRDQQIRAAEKRLELAGI